MSFEGGSGDNFSSEKFPPINNIHFYIRTGHRRVWAFGWVYFWFEIWYNIRDIIFSERHGKKWKIQKKRIYLTE